MNRRLAGLLGMLGLVLLLGWYFRQRAWLRPAAGGPMSSAAAEAVARGYLAIEEREQSAARQTWGEELEAERHEDEVIRWWDALNAATNAWAVLERIPVARASWPAPGAPESLPHGITRRTGEGGAPMVLDAAGWSAQLATWSRSGWSWSGSHWAMVGHEPPSAGRPARSVIRLQVRLERESPRERATLRVRLRVTWRPDASGLEELTAEHVEWLHRAGEPPFRLWMEAELAPDAGLFPDPLIIRDLDGDGRPELLLVGAGERWRNRTESPDAPTPFVREPWPGLPKERIQAAVMADADGDRREDLILAGVEGVRWMSGSNSWAATGMRSGWSAPEPLKHPQAIAAGDVDADGDTDLWVVQYKLPYQQGQFPTPWWDARDGFPASLLLNDGAGRFTDVTPAAGLDPVRRRRS
ncbi:MAG: VCBS repeat-containing protein, partial [Verrucomicrobia bacterium]|nr:VCBS repeat-containing protein [Verrucomicrobiota bacterium]